MDWVNTSLSKRRAPNRPGGFLRGSQLALAGGFCCPDDLGVLGVSRLDGPAYTSTLPDGASAIRDDRHCF
jgi:hypothetical protein